MIVSIILTTLLSLAIPLHPNSPICAVSLLKDHFQKHPMPETALLFYHDDDGTHRAIVYREVLSFLKSLVSGIGLDPDQVGLHSLRRSGAGFLHSIKVPLEDIKCIGDWASLAVLSYLVTPTERKLDIERTACTALGQLLA